MKKIILASLVLSTLFVSCKKDDPAPASCEKTLAGIAGNYKLTSYTLTTLGIPNDLTSTINTACGAAAIYALKADGTTTFTGTGAACTATGTWSVTGSNITLDLGADPNLDLTAFPITSWNCSALTLSKTESLLGIDVVTTVVFTKQ